VNVPDVRNETTQAAIDKLQSVGLKTSLQDPVYSDTVNVGLVVSTDPAGGKRIKTSQVVKIFPSAGKKFVTVPDVTGKTKEEAASILQQNGLKLGKVTTKSSDTVAKGRVISQNPGSGSALQAGKTVDITVSSGKALTTVPSVVGLSQADAEDALRRAGLNPQVVQDPTCFDASGNVCRQDPAAGQQVVEGSTVTIYVPVTSGSPSPTPSDTTTPTPTPSF
jgi:serine/threonine-protein kinase